MDTNNFNRSMLKPFFIFGLLTKFVKLQDPWPQESTWREIWVDDFIWEGINKEDSIISNKKSGLVHYNDIWIKM